MITSVIEILNKYEIQSIDNNFEIHIDAVDNLEDVLRLGVELNKYGYDIDSVGTQNIFTQTTIISIERLNELGIVPQPMICEYCEKWKLDIKICSVCGIDGCRACMDTKTCKECGGIICDDCASFCIECSGNVCAVIAFCIECGGNVCDDCAEYNDAGEGPYCNECLSDIDDSSYEWE